MLKTHGRECRRGLVVQAAVRPVMIIVHLPTLCNAFRLIDTDRPGEAGQKPGTGDDVSVLRRLLLILSLAQIAGAWGQSAQNV